VKDGGITSNLLYAVVLARVSTDGRADTETGFNRSTQRTQPTYN